ncbi:CAAX prenyl protease-like protein [Kineothrix alysoides]|uniref:CAAX prenyl protease-like protein n=1 Tax=Kineothrix alysoides TaxID=1469948 RepID=A0A4R1R3M1_9FIRM|nr:type II CAAX endopeptidase family protein [Kineothrix alysoides]TCL60024.1 CAAX prenyl protease-like protein [Kineothrix alysoides]
MIKREEQKKTMQRAIYLVLVLGISYLLFVIALFVNDNSNNPIYEILQKGFTAFPVLAAIIARGLTRDKTPWRISIKVWKQPKLWVFCAFIPSILIVLGAVSYFMLFPNDYSGGFHYGSLLALTGAEVNGIMKINNPVVFWMISVLISAVFIPIQLLELGEEIGWRAYLLPKQIERYGMRKAVLLNGVLWGIAHLPLIYFGFNYSSDNPGAPWSNMAMMLLTCVILGVILSYVMIISGNVMYPAIIHGAVNVIGEVPVYLTISQKSGLLGPNPTGLVGMMGLILCAIVLFVCLGKADNKLTIEGKGFTCLES